MNTLVSTAVATTILNPLQVVITRYALVDTTKNPLNGSIFSSIHSTSVLLLSFADFLIHNSRFHLSFWQFDKEVAS